VSLPFRELARQAAGPLIRRCTFAEEPGPLACAVSGGADSLALLVLAVAADRDAVAHHVDHGLRKDSCEDAHVVNEVAAALGVAVVVHRVALDDGPNLEARARTARHTVLPAGAATGHTADDQAETVLLNLLRGAATDGLAAMRAGARHPILGLRRAETHELCAQLGLHPVQDPTNRDPAHLRNRVRHELLPVLCELAGRDVVPILARQARLMADDATLLDDLAGALDPTDARSIAGAPTPLARRALREWLRCGHPPDSATVDRVLSVAAGSSLAAEIGSGRTVRRTRGRLRIEPAVSATSERPEVGVEAALRVGSDPHPPGAPSRSPGSPR
jgi:tRNA(Ile)-lysidine synthase